MKGLLIKDWYMMKAYCRSYLIIAAVFLILSLFNESIFFLFYPCMLCGMIPMNLLGYDERSRWLQYSCTMPYTRKQIVSEKYLIGLVVQVAVLLTVGIAQGVRMGLDGTFNPRAYLSLLLFVLIAATVSSSIALPFLFRYGIERGRTSYYVMIGFVCAFSVLASGYLSDPLRAEVLPAVFLPVLALGGIGIYALSWYLSVIFYTKREI